MIVLYACLYYMVGCVVAVLCAVAYAQKRGRGFNPVEWIFAIVFWPLCAAVVVKRAWQAVSHA